MLGYACIALGLKEEGRFKVTTPYYIRGFNIEDREQILRRNARINITRTLGIIKYNIDNKILMYRLSSNIVNLYSHAYNCYNFMSDDNFLMICSYISEAQKIYNLRLSFHLDHYYYLSTNNNLVLQNTIRELSYISKLCDLVGAKDIVVHVGSTQGGKNNSIRRFIDNFDKLDNDIQRKIIIENDDKSYNVEEVLDICNVIGVPMVPDMHHNKIHRSSLPIEEYVDSIYYTWKGRRPKAHISSGYSNKYDRRHSDYIDYLDYIDYKNKLGYNFDLMLEAKAKDFAVLKILEEYLINEKGVH